jgi:protein O-mannosyl-transferase
MKPQNSPSASPAVSADSTPDASIESDRWMVLGICIFLTAIIWVVFGQAVHHEFVNFDDDVYVYKNGMVFGGLNSTSVAWAFTEVHSSNWHPLTWLSHMLDCQWYGLNPAGHHRTNVLLHTATAILLFLVLRQMFSNAPPLPSPLLHTRRGGEGASAPARDIPSPRDAGAGRGSGSGAALWCSAFVAAVFAIHPLRVESVAWVAERKDVLSGLFFVLTLMAYVRCVNPKTEIRNPKETRTPNSEKENPPGANSGFGLRTSFGFRISDFGFFLRSPFYWLTLLFFALGLMSKPMLVTLPFVLLLLDYWPLQRVSGVTCQVSGDGAFRASLLRLVVEKFPLLILSGAVCLTTLLAQKEAMSHLPLSVRAGNAAVSYVAYLKQMFYPSGLAVFYPYPETGLALAKIIAAVLLLLAISAVAIVARRKHPWLLIGWLWYLGMLVPAIGILQVGSQAQADRYTYLPQIGLYLALTWIAADWCAGRRSRGLMLGGFSVVILVALIFCARTQTAHWRNNESLWTHTLACTADSLTARINFGNALLEQGRVDEAMVHYQKALQLRPDDPEANVSFGYGLIQKGKPAEAAGYFQKALANKPNHAAAHNDLGNVLARKGAVDEAIVHFQEALRIKPDYAEASYNLGNALFEKGDLGAAITSYRKALQIKPDYVEACFNLGNALFQKGEVDEAIVQYQKALHVRPDYTRACYNLGMALVQKRRADEAIACFEKVLQLKPDHAEAHFNLGHALLQKERGDQAIAHFKQALQIKPDYAEAQNDLAWELATCPQASLRNGNQAVELAERANQLAGGADVDILDTLAAAYAEAGRFDDAIRSAQKAIELAQAAGQKDPVAQLNRELKLYQTGHPFHQDRK